MSGRIDVHQHILPAAYVDALGPDRIGAVGSAGRMPDWSIARALERMDQFGIATAITSISAPGLVLDDDDAIVRLARACNDFAAGMVADHPGRFGIFATLPWTDADDSLREIEYAYDTLNADGVCMLSNYRGHYAGESMFRPIFAELNRRRAVVFVHPTAYPNMPRQELLSASTLEFPFDTTRAIGSLVAGGVLTERPDIRFIFSHAGGAMPYLAGRIETLAPNNPRLAERLGPGIGALLARHYYDTALSANRYAFAALRAMIPVERILFGSDFPYGPPDQIASTIAGLAAIDLATPERAAIDRRNALDLFPRIAALL